LPNEKERLQHSGGGIGSNLRILYPALVSSLEEANEPPAWKTIGGGFAVGFIVILGMCVIVGGLMYVLHRQLKEDLPQHGDKEMEIYSAESPEEVDELVEQEDEKEPAVEWGPFTSPNEEEQDQGVGTMYL